MTSLHYLADHEVTLERENMTDREIVKSPCEGRGGRLNVMDEETMKNVTDGETLILLLYCLTVLAIDYCFAPYIQYGFGMLSLGSAMHVDAHLLTVSNTL